MKSFLEAILLVYFAAAFPDSTVKLAKNINVVKKAQSDMINNYYTGANCKKIKDQLAEIKQDVRQLNENITDSCAGDRLHADVQQQLEGIKVSIAELRENVTGAASVPNSLFSEVRQQVAELKEELRALNENLTGGPEGNGVLSEVKQQLVELKEEIRGLKGGKAPTTASTPTTKPIPSTSTAPITISTPTTTPKPTTFTIYPKNCAKVYQSGNKISGVYKIDPDGLGEFEVFCDQTTASGGWTVFQKRFDGSVDFYRGWDDYKRGFGNLTGEFWLGLDKIHRLTVSSNNKLRVDLEDSQRNKVFTEFYTFVVGNETEKYKLTLRGGSTGTAKDSLYYHNGLPFTTKDQDNDRSSTNCATQWKGAWWYNNCHLSNLNGLYIPGRDSAQGMSWYSWKKNHVSMRKSQMKLRSKPF